MRFSVLYHYNIDKPHYDLLFENSGYLDSWRISEKNLKVLLSGETAEIEPIPQHDIKYLDYEGDLSQGKGSVNIFDRGKTSYQGIAGEETEFLIFGSVLSGKVLIKKKQQQVLY